MTGPKRPVGRPPGTGPDTEPVLLKLSPALLQLATSASKTAGVARAEWLRRAVLHYVASGSPDVSAIATTMAALLRDESHR